MDFRPSKDCEILCSPIRDLPHFLPRGLTVRISNSYRLDTLLPFPGKIGPYDLVVITWSPMHFPKITPTPLHFHVIVLHLQCGLKRTLGMFIPPYWIQAHDLNSIYSKKIYTWVKTLLGSSLHFCFLKILFIIFVCAGSSLLCADYLIVMVLELWCSGFSLWWFLFVQSMRSRVCRLSSCSVCALEGGSVVVGHGFSCSMAWGIFPYQGLNLCPLHQQADS